MLFRSHVTFWDHAMVGLNLLALVVLAAFRTPHHPMLWGVFLLFAATLFIALSVYEEEPNG